MNETVLDVLMYLFENFSDQDYEQSPDQMVLREELLIRGNWVDHSLWSLLDREYRALRRSSASQ